MSFSIFFQNATNNKVMKRIMQIRALHSSSFKSYSASSKNIFRNFTLKFNWGFHSCGLGGEAETKNPVFEVRVRVSSRTKHFILLIVVCLGALDVWPCL